MYLSMTPIQTFHNLSKSFTVFRHIRYSIIFIFLMESSQSLCHPLWMSYPLCLHFLSEISFHEHHSYYFHLSVRLEILVLVYQFFLGLFSHFKEFSFQYLLEQREHGKYISELAWLTFIYPTLNLD